VLRQPNHKLQATEIAALVAAYEGGTSIAALAIQFELHYETARAHLLWSGVVLRGNAKPATREQRLEMIWLHREGTTNKTIAKRLGVSPRTVGRVLRADDMGTADA
jgi:transposase